MFSLNLGRGVDQLSKAFQVESVINQQFLKFAINSYFLAYELLNQGWMGIWRARDLSRQNASSLKQVNLLKSFFNLMKSQDFNFESDENKF